MRQFIGAALYIVITFGLVPPAYSQESGTSILKVNDPQDAWSGGVLLQSIGDAQGVGIELQAPWFLPMKSTLRLAYSRMGLEESTSFDLIELLWVNFMTPPGNLWKARTFWALGLAATSTSNESFFENSYYPVEVNLGVEFGPAEIVPYIGMFAPTLAAAYVFGNGAGSPVNIGNELKLIFGLRYYL